jgi:hypothetical protein
MPSVKCVCVVTCPAALPVMVKGVAVVEIGAHGERPPQRGHHENQE